MKSENIKKVTGALRIALLVVISVVFGFGIYRWNAQSLTGNIMPMPFGVGVGVVMSGSMEPELSVDDVIFVQEKATYEVGDVVVFQQKNVLVVHKIIAIDADMVTTQGTANNTPDEPMNVSAIKGVVTFHIEGLGGVVNWLKSPFGTICILAVAGLLLVWSYSTEKKEKDERDEQIDEIKREIEKLKGHCAQPAICRDKECHCEGTEAIPQTESNGHCERSEAIPQTKSVHPLAFSSGRRGTALAVDEVLKNNP